MAVTRKGEINRLQEKIRKKYGEYDDSLDMQVEATADNRLMLDKLHKEIMHGTLTSLVVGSQGQTKTEVNPLIAAYDKAQRTYLQQLAALGLNKLSVKKEDAQTVKTGEDPLANFYKKLTIEN